jgi:ribonuclease P protein component
MTAGAASSSSLRRLTKRAQFLNAAKGRRAGRTALALQAIPVSNPEAGLGFTVTKKAGTATERNRIRRRLRAAARACGDAFKPQHDYVLVGRRDALSLPFDKIVADLSSAIHKVHAAERGPGHARP